MSPQLPGCLGKQKSAFLLHIHYLGFKGKIYNTIFLKYKFQVHNASYTLKINGLKIIQFVSLWTPSLVGPIWTKPALVVLIQRGIGCCLSLLEGKMTILLEYRHPRVKVSLLD